MREHVERCFQATGFFDELREVGDCRFAQFNTVVSEQLLDFHELQIFQSAFVFVVHINDYRCGLLAV